MLQNTRDRTPLSDLTAQVSPEEFTFCCSLLYAALYGQIATENPQKHKILIHDSKADAAPSSKASINRAMLAVRQHYIETRKENQRAEFLPMAFRLMCFADLVSSAIGSNDAQFREWVVVENGQIKSIDSCLSEAAAVTKIGPNGFNLRELLSEATRRVKLHNSRH